MSLDLDLFGKVRKIFRFQIFIACSYRGLTASGVHHSRIVLECFINKTPMGVYAG